MPPQEDKVWISREEYDRLRQAEFAARPVVDGQPVAPLLNPITQVDASATLQKMRRSWSRVAGVLAIVLIISFSVSSLRWLAGIVVLVFLVLAILTPIDYYQTKKRLNRAVAGQPVYGVPVQSRSLGKTLLVIVGCVLLAPVLIYGGMILLFIILFASSGGQGS